MMSMASLCLDHVQFTCDVSKKHFFYTGRVIFIRFGTSESFLHGLNQYIQAVAVSFMVGSVAAFKMFEAILLGADPCCGRKKCNA